MGGGGVTSGINPSVLLFKQGRVVVSKMGYTPVSCFEQGRGWWRCQKWEIPPPSCVSSKGGGGDTYVNYTVMTNMSY